MALEDLQLVPGVFLARGGKEDAKIAAALTCRAGHAALAIQFVVETSGAALTACFGGMVRMMAAYSAISTKFQNLVPAYLPIMAPATRSSTRAAAASSRKNMKLAVGDRHGERR
jgi:hypothetical protein